MSYGIYEKLLTGILSPSIKRVQGTVFRKDSKVVRLRDVISWISFEFSFQVLNQSTNTLCKTLNHHWQSHFYISRKCNK